MKCYAAYAKNISERNLGSSGGIYPLLARKYVERGAVVYASVYDKYSVKFKRISNLDSLSKTFTSKYVQSDSSGIFEQVKKDLSEGLNVLFCGTPCHVQALTKYLATFKIDTNNLLKIEVICHGVPSEYLFERFMNEYYNGECQELNMRSKENGWNWGSYSWKMRLLDNKEIIIKQDRVPYMKAFLSDAFLRPSCYNCQSKASSFSDIILGDFWGVTNLDIQLDDRYGVSCIILNTEEGEKAFNSILNDIDCWKVNYQDILSNNPALLNSSSMPFKRKYSYRKLKKTDNVQKYLDNISQKNILGKGINKIYQKVQRRKTQINLKCKNEQAQYSCIYKYKEGCCGCMACVSVCPKNAMNKYKDEEGFWYSVKNEALCVDCGLCKKVCPQHSF